MGKNKARLMALFASRLAIPSGGGFADGLDYLVNPDKFKAVNQKALELTDQAIQAMRAAPDNPYGDDEEAIAAGIIAEVDKR